MSSALLGVEGRRAAARYGSAALARARRALTAVTLLPLDNLTLDAAAELDPPELRALDAIHLATAVSLRGDLRCVYCYDARLSHAAAELGLDVGRPA